MYYWYWRILFFILKYPYFDKKDKCNGSLFNLDYEKETIIKKIELIDIKQIFKRRYYYKKNALEIYTIYNKSYYFIFETQNEKDLIFNTIYHSNNISQITFPDNLINYMKDWENWSIDTFHY